MMKNSKIRSVALGLLVVFCFRKTLSRGEEEFKFYVYDLQMPNLELRANERIGTHQFLLSALLYPRFMNDSHRTEDPIEASVFVIPIDYEKFRQTSACQDRDSGRAECLCEQIGILKIRVEELQAELRPDLGSIQQKQMLVDHLVVLGRPLSFVFRDWGKVCVKTFDWLRRMQILTIEANAKIDRGKTEAVLDLRSSLALNDNTAWTDGYGLKAHHVVPYPSIHVREHRNDILGLRAFQKTVQRKHLASLILGLHNRKGSSLRATLSLTCSNRPETDCIALLAPNCTNRGPPRDDLVTNDRESILYEISRYLKSNAPGFCGRNVFFHYASTTFCLQPTGMTPTRQGMYHCLLAGTIPVIFEPYWLQALSGWFSNDNWAVYISTQTALEDTNKNVFDFLQSIPRDNVTKMQATIREAVPRLQYYCSKERGGTAERLDPNKTPLPKGWKNQQPDSNSVQSSFSVHSPRLEEDDAYDFAIKKVAAYFKEHRGEQPLDHQY